MAAARERIGADRRFELLDEEQSDATDEAGAHGGGDGRPAKRPRPDAEAADGASASAASAAAASPAAASAGAASSASPASVVRFQLVGAALYGITRQQLERVHGVDVSGLTATYLQRLNASIANATATATAGEGGGWRAKPCLLGAYERAAPGARPQFTARFAVGGRCRLEHVWPVLCEVADEVLGETYARLDLCKCDTGAVILSRADAT